MGGNKGHIIFLIIITISSYYMDVNIKDYRSEPGYNNYNLVGRWCDIDVPNTNNNNSFADKRGLRKLKRIQKTDNKQN